MYKRDSRYVMGKNILIPCAVFHFFYILLVTFVSPLCVLSRRQCFDELLNIVRGQDDLRIDEDGPAIVFHCRTGKSRTTTAMVIAGLIVCQIKVSRSN